LEAAVLSPSRKPPLSTVPADALHVVDRAIDQQVGHGVIVIRDDDAIQAERVRRCIGTACSSNDRLWSPGSPGQDRSA
jgi:hypothetical protein